MAHPPVVYRKAAGPWRRFMLSVLIAANFLTGFVFMLWLLLPEHWRSQTFVAAAARRGIALTPSTTFAVAHGHAPNAVRLALAPPSPEQLESGLRTLASLLGTKEEDLDSTE